MQVLAIELAPACLAGVARHGGVARARKTRRVLTLVFVVEPLAGYDPATYGLRNRCSTTELQRRVVGVVVTRGCEIVQVVVPGTTDPSDLDSGAAVTRGTVLRDRRGRGSV